ncbi:helix-turn-helix domain-containing protein [Weissella soli]|uniref:helix-turn-helix domain-containing protein n=1 Tax=Weissella soli TaxID=155866 RepID=UPI0011BBECBE|nr:helix-turn-helix domain-containing protein [Weissella soli]QEA34798.1 helix-turn-helix domain-containing protein [Weissella soli]
MTIFERTKEIAKKRGLSLQDTATAAGIGINSIYGWKNKKPSIDRIKAVADVLGVSVDYLLGNTDDMHSSNTQNKQPVDLKQVVDDENWDEWLSFDGKPLSEADKEIIRRLFSE